MAKHAKEKTLNDMHTPHEMGVMTAAASGLPLLSTANPISGLIGMGAAYAVGRGVQSYRRYRAGGPNAWGEPQQHSALNKDQFKGK